MELVGQGRDCDVFALDDGTVLRRSREGRSQETEARVLTHLAEQGFPVPTVIDLQAGGQDLVLERIEGPTMMDDLGAHPWRVRAHARTLAALHDALHRIPAPDWLPDLDDGGDRFVHLDLHPMNVMLGPDGPVVIDWARASRGTAASDVARTWAILGGGDTGDRGPMRVLVAVLRWVLVRTFLAHAGRDQAARRLRWAVDLTITDSHMSPAEQEALRRLGDRWAVEAD